jgi:hypothetical protein
LTRTNRTKRGKAFGESGSTKILLNSQSGSCQPFSQKSNTAKFHVYVRVTKFRSQKYIVINYVDMYVMWSFIGLEPYVIIYPHTYIMQLKKYYTHCQRLQLIFSMCWGQILHNIVEEFTYGDNVTVRRFMVLSSQVFLLKRTAVSCFRTGLPI